MDIPPVAPPAPSAPETRLMEPPLAPALPPELRLRSPPLLAPVPNPANRLRLFPTVGPPSTLMLRFAELLSVISPVERGVKFALPATSSADAGTAVPIPNRKFVLSQN